MFAMLPRLNHRLLAICTGGLLLGAALARAEEPGHLTLGQAWTLAQRHHPALAAAEAQARAAQARVDVAQLPYLPIATLDFSGAETTANYVAKPGALPKDLIRASAPTSLELWTFWQGGASAQWTVTDFGKTAATVAAAQGLAEAARADVAEVQRTLWLQLANTYGAAWLAGRHLTLAERTRDLAEQRHKLVQALVSRNMKPAADLARADGDLAMAELAVDEQRGQLQTARAALGVWLGDAPIGNLAAVAVPVGLPGAVSASLDDLARELATRDPQMLGLEALRRAAQAEVVAAERAQRPAVYLASGVAMAGQHLPSPTVNAQVAAGIAWQGSSLWTSGALAAQARAKLPLIAARQQEVLRAKRLELSQTRSGVSMALARRPLLQRAEQTAQAAEVAAELRYQSGVGLLSEVLDATAARTQVEGRKLAAEQELLAAELRWRAALGQLGGD